MSGLWGCFGFEICDDCGDVNMYKEAIMSAKDELSCSKCFPNTMLDMNFAGSKSAQQYTTSSDTV